MYKSKTEKRNKNKTPTIQSFSALDPSPKIISLKKLPSDVSVLLKQCCWTSGLEGWCPAGFPDLLITLFGVKQNKVLIGLTRVTRWLAGSRKRKPGKPAGHQPSRPGIWHLCYKKRSLCCWALVVDVFVAGTLLSVEKMLNH